MGRASEEIKNNGSSRSEVVFFFPGLRYPGRRFYASMKDAAFTRRVTCFGICVAIL